MLGNALRPSWPVKLALNVDAMTLGGATVQNVGSDLRSDGTTWTVDRLELRAPGFTQVKVDGRLYPLGKGLGFAGGASVDSNDPKNLVAWLAGHADHGGAVQAVARQGRRDASGGPDRGRAAAHRDRSRRGRGQPVLRLAGRRPAGARRWRASRGRARSRRRDRLWRVRAVRPGAGAAGRGHAGAWRSAAPRLPASTRATSPRVSSSTPADLRSNGCRSATSAIPSFVATGRIQTQSSPGGSITVNLDARDLNGILALSERFAPALAGPLRRLAARQKTATLQASVSMESSGADGASGKIGLTGKIGAVRVNVSASATGKREAFMVTDLGALAGADVRIDGQFEADATGAVARTARSRSDRRRRAASRRGSRFRRTGRSAANCDSKASSPPGRSMRAARARCGSRPISRRRSISISSPARSAAARCRASGRFASATCRGSTGRSRRNRSTRRR